MPDLNVWRVVYDRPRGVMCCYTVLAESADEAENLCNAGSDWNFASATRLMKPIVLRYDSGLAARALAGSR